jgi:hypothetical protein
LVFILGSFAWAATATALTAAIPTVESAAPTLMLTYFPVIIISGIFGSVSEPHWLYTIAQYFPARPLIHALAISLGHTAGHSLLPVRDLVILAAWAIAGMTAAVATFRWEPNRPARRPPAPRRSPSGSMGTCATAVDQAPQSEFRPRGLTESRGLVAGRRGDGPMMRGRPDMGLTNRVA